MRTLIAITIISMVLAAQDQEASTSKTTVKFQGASGSMKLYPSADSNAFLMVSQSKIQEFDASGNGLNGQGKSVNLAAAGGDWATPTKTTKDRATVWQTDYTANAGSGTFKLTAYLFLNSTTVQNGNQTVQVPDNSLKFDVDFTNWGFANSANTLHYTITVLSKGGDNSANKENTDQNKVNAYKFSGGQIDVPTTAVVDGVTKDINVTVVSSKSSATEIQFVFPSFTNTLSYDPVITTGDATSGAAATTFSALLLAVTMLIAALFQ